MRTAALPSPPHGKQAQIPIGSSLLRLKVCIKFPIAYIATLCYIRRIQTNVWPINVGRGESIPREYRINQRIRVPEVRLVDDEGEQLGVMATNEAMKIADDRGLDLVEVAPGASPPVARLLDYGKFKYEATRKEREARKARKTKATNELREVRMKTRIGKHDRDAKTRLVKRLLGEGSKVKVSVMFRGREIDHPELGMRLLRSVAEDLVDDALLERPPVFEGRFLAMILSPNAKPEESKSEQPEEVLEEELDSAKA